VETQNSGGSILHGSVQAVQAVVLMLLMVLSQPTNLLAHQKKSQKIKLTNIIEFDLCFFVCYTNTFGFV